MSSSRMVCCQHPSLCPVMPLINHFEGLWAIPFYSCIQATGEPTWNLDKSFSAMQSYEERSQQQEKVGGPKPSENNKFTQARCDSSYFMGFPSNQTWGYCIQPTTWWNKTLPMLMLSFGRPRMLWLDSWSLSWQRLGLWESWSGNLKPIILTRLLPSFLEWSDAHQQTWTYFDST